MHPKYFEKLINWYLMTGFTIDSRASACKTDFMDQRCRKSIEVYAAEDS